jgi:hypothetical protein
VALILSQNVTPNLIQNAASISQNAAFKQAVSASHFSNISVI